MGGLVGVLGRGGPGAPRAGEGRPAYLRCGLCARVSPRQLPPGKVSGSGLRSDGTIWETQFWVDLRFLAAVISHFCPGDWISSGII